MLEAMVSPGTVTLIGSGEMAASMGKVHRAVMSRIAGPVRAVFLDTPAGFELNADGISARAVEYFKQNLNLDLAVASFKAATRATPDEVESVLCKLQPANYIFAGPGSPTYAIRNWQGTAVRQGMVQRLATGAHLVFASAAAIAMGRYALPVYEIYKVGEEPHWVEGLDLLRPYGMELAIVPHWNNAEGGTYDTRFCFMGEPRMRLLEQDLPASTSILGIDEYTACIVDLGSGICQVMGAGQVTVRHKGSETTHPAGSQFDLGLLKRSGPDREIGGQGDKGTRGRGDKETRRRGDKETRRRGDKAIRGEAAGEPPAGWSDWPECPDDEADARHPAADAAPFVEVLVQVRTHLRAAKQWGLADEIRQRLAELGIVLEDGPTETTWRQA